VGLLSAAMLAELKKQAPDAVFLFTFTLGATTYRFSDTGRLDTAGLYEPKVLSWGGAIRRGVNVFDNVLELQNVEIMLDDTDRSLAALLQGASRNLVRGATATVVLASRNVGSGDWFTLFSGRIDSCSQAAPLTWSFELSPNALPLRRESVPKTRINVSDWPSSAVAVRDLPVPIAYGRISSSNEANNGAVPCYLVDASGFRYLVAAGWLKAVDTVYKDAVPVAAAGYAITHPIVNGRVFTLIDFTTTQGTSTITADVQGYEDVGDGTGTLITDPAAIGQHLLVNWIFGDYKAGLWLSPSSAPVDTTSFATTFFSARGYEASVYIGSAKRRGLDVVNDALKSFEARACWTPAGKIALKVEDFTAWAYVPDLVLVGDEISGWNLTFPIATLVDEIEAQYARTPTGGYTQTLAVKDLVTGEDAPDALALPYSPAFFL